MVLNNQSNGRDDRWSKSYGCAGPPIEECSFSDATVKVLTTKNVALPQFHSAGAAGFDLASSSDVLIPPGKIRIVPTGLHMIIPEFYEGQIRARSSLATKGIAIVNAPGTIDSDYRGEIKIIMVNIGKHNFQIKKEDRVAQMIIASVPKVQIMPVTLVEWTNLCYGEDGRGEGGFGSTGK
mgnify:CR=1 FL=1|tara:strand:- start:229 stop:768 length:540 start_codon:yes stop_codon:yes gene_type:complete